MIPNENNDKKLLCLHQFLMLVVSKYKNVIAKMVIPEITKMENVYKRLFKQQKISASFKCNILLLKFGMIVLKKTFKLEIILVKLLLPK